LAGVAATHGKPQKVAFKHFDISETMMRKRNRLCALQMRVARYDDRLISFREPHQGTFQFPELFNEINGGVANPEAHVCRYLIIPAPGGVQLLAGGTDFFNESSFDIHVDVFERGIPLEFTGVNFTLDGFEATRDLAGFGFGDQAGLGQAFGVSDGAGNVLPVKSPVETDAFGELPDGLGRPGGKSATPC